MYGATNLTISGSVAMAGVATPLSLVCGMIWNWSNRVCLNCFCFSRDYCFNILFRDAVLNICCRVGTVDERCSLQGRGWRCTFAMSHWVHCRTIGGLNLHGTISLGLGICTGRERWLTTVLANLTGELGSFAALGSTASGSSLCRLAIREGASTLPGLGAALPFNLWNLIFRGWIAFSHSTISCPNVWLCPRDLEHRYLPPPPIFPATLA